MQPLKGTRRSLLAGVAACVGCGEQSAPEGAPTDCTGPSAGEAQPYCLLVKERVRIRGGATLGVGDALLLNVDDATAVILARDERGLFARSAICPHACCVVALCTDAACDALTPSPGGCGSTVVVRPDPTGGIICPCHGSKFRLSDGAVLTGPARAALRAYAVEVDGADAWVDTGTVADPQARI